MRKFEAPELEVNELVVEDVITTSIGGKDDTTSDDEL